MLPVTVTKPFEVEFKFHKFEVTPVSKINDELFSFAVNIIIKDERVSVDEVKQNVHSWMCQNANKMELLAVEFNLYYSELIVKIDSKYINEFMIRKMIESLSGLIMKLKYKV